MGHLPSLLSCFMRTLKNLGNIVLKKVAQILLYSKHSTLVLFAKFVVCIYNGSLTHYHWGWDLIQEKTGLQTDWEISLYTSFLLRFKWEIKLNVLKVYLIWQVDDFELQSKLENLNQI